MEKFFEIRYEFDKAQVHAAIDARLREPGSDYICVADGNILALVHQDEKYREVINGGMFSVCDSGYVPLYLKWLYGIKRSQYCGSDIFIDIISSGKYKMSFLGTNQHVLEQLRRELTAYNPAVADMGFHELPFCTADEFDYPGIARMVEEEAPDIVWVALGAPKQEKFMARLKPHLHHGVMIAVGAAFQFYSKCGVKRAPKWMIKCKMEWVYRIWAEPRKQLKRVGNLIPAMFGTLRAEYAVKKKHKTKPAVTL